MYSLFLKEIRSFLSSFLGYIIIVVFLIVMGLFLWVLPTDFNILDFGYANVDGLFIIAPFIFLFLVPAITMRSFADENKTGTIELLYTRPISDLQIILAKYCASFTLVILSLIPTLVYYFSVWQLGFPQGNIDSVDSGAHLSVCYFWEPPLFQLVYLHLRLAKTRWYLLL